MSINNILVLIVLMSLGIFNFIQAEVVRGVDLPRLDTSKMLGKWYRLTYLPRDIGLSSCSINILERQSEDRFTMSVTRTYTPEASENSPPTPNAPVEFVIHTAIQEDTNILVTTINGVVSAMVMFDVEYDSHIAIYTTPTREQIFDGDEGFYFLLARQKTLPDEIIQRVRQSTFFQQGLKPGTELILLDTSYCP